MSQALFQSMAVNKTDNKPSVHGFCILVGRDRQIDKNRYCATKMLHLQSRPAQR